MNPHARKTLSLMAALLLVAAIFPVQRVIDLQGQHIRLAAREVTLMWSPILTLSGTSERSPFRTELDWDTSTLEFVIIASVSFLYFAWLESGLQFLKVQSVWRRVPFGVRDRLRVVIVVLLVIAIIALLYECSRRLGFH